MKKKNILICLERLGIGGVETYAISQALALKKKNYNVIIASKDGIYREIVEKKGIKWINIDFQVENYYDFGKIEKIMNVIIENNITEVHMHTFVTTSILFPACVMTNVPYLIYVHTGVNVIEETFEWFKNVSVVLKEGLKDVFEYAYKIVTINNQTIEYIKENYNIVDDNKFRYIRNSIDFDEYKSNRNIEEINKILIISRLEELKYKSVLNGIRLFSILNKNKNMTLRIAGDGDKKEELEEYVKKEKISNVTFLGAITNVKDEIEKSDAVIGVARCILEAISMRRLPIISGYTGMRDILSEDNYDTELNENFAGKQLKVKDIDEIADKIEKMKSHEIAKIIDYNYNKSKEKLDINKNLYTVKDNDKSNYERYSKEILIHMIKINDKLGRLAENRFEKMENDWKEHLKYKEYMEKQLDDTKKEVDRLKKEIKIYENSKPIIIFNRIKRLLGKKGI